MLELTNTEQTIMKCIWDIGREVTVADLLECLKSKYRKEYARTTISVFMSYLRDKGFVTYERKSHAFVYKPLVSESEYQKNLMRHYLDRNFDHSLIRFIEAALNNHRPSREECNQIREMIVRYESN